MGTTVFQKWPVCWFYLNINVTGNWMTKLGIVLLAVINPGMKNCSFETDSKNWDEMMLAWLLSECERPLRFTVTVSTSSS